MVGANILQQLGLVSSGSEVQEAKKLPKDTGSFFLFEGDELCNYTLGYLSCFDNSCYMEDQRCDGAKQCKDGADEMGCTYSVSVS